jgi:hypothetical protein
MAQLYKIFIGVILMAFVFSCERYESPTTLDASDFVKFNQAESSVLENTASPALIMVSLSTTSNASTSAEFSVSGGEVGVSHEIMNTSTSLTFNQENNFTDTIRIQPIDNAENSDTDVVLSVSLTNAGAASIGYPGPDGLNSAHTLTIIDDDCETTNLAGIYNTTTTGQSTDGCCPDVTTVTGTMEVTDLGGGNYLLFDFSAGLYFEWYEIYGVSAAYIAGGGAAREINLQCDEITGAFTEPFSSPATLSGTVDFATGVIVYSWTNGFMDTATVTMTPQ